MADECSLEVLRLEHEPPEDFGLCVCQGPRYLSGIYVFLRELFSSFNFSMVVWAIVLSVLEKNLKLYIFFDFWTQILLFVSSEVGIYGPYFKWSADAKARSFHSSRNSDDDDYWDYLPWYCRLYWALFSAALPSTFLSCVTFWIQVYKKNSPIIQVVMNSASPSIALLEFIMIAFPLRLLNFFYFVIFYLVYVLFTFVYYRCGGTGVEDSDPIYKVLDWNQPGKAVLAVLVGLSIGLGAYFFFCFLSMIKMACRNRLQYD